MDMETVTPIAVQASEWESKYNEMATSAESRLNRIERYRSQVSYLEQYLTDNWDEDTAEHFTAIADIFKISLTKSFSVEVSISGRLTVTAPIGTTEDEIASQLEASIETNYSDIVVEDYHLDIDSVDISDY
jgi:hypothetical protein